MVARRFKAVVPAEHVIEGGGFGVSRPFPTAALDMFDPFLMLDEKEPVDYGPGEAIGAPDHPHRGFETVSYVLSGETEHRDSNGGHGFICTGDIQWMTAGSGIVHSEMPSKRLQAEGGHVHGFQMWVNLPRADKLMAPKYQSLEAADLGLAEGDGWSVKVIAGSVLGADGPATTQTPIGYAHLTAEAGTRLEIPVPDDHNAGLYVFVGDGVLGEEAAQVSSRALAMYAREPGDMVLEVPQESPIPLQALILTGRPLDEPVARQGPFVMNTREELAQAFEDYQAGRMGTIVHA